jgi:acetate kinase
VRVLVVNAGSSSLKLRLVDADDRVAGRADLPAVGRASPDDIATWARATRSAIASSTGASGSASPWWWTRPCGGRSTS